ncbi:hypothetical protein [Herbiconiux liangxiaofengii]|uniref:hypothetical protein n=1 Tax=Herbiconiux liangxiaofengii TaxID=3342795 RepID=UPI0035B8399C
MPRRVQLPEHLLEHPFAVHDGTRAGVSPKRMRGSDLSSPYPGVRRFGAPPDGLLERCRAYAQRMSHDQLFSHGTAALLWGIPLPDEYGLREIHGRPERDPAILHVASLNGTRPRVAGVRGHELSDRRIRCVLRHGLRVTDAASTWVHLAASLTLPDLVAAGDHLVLTPRSRHPIERRPFCGVDDLVARLRNVRGGGHVKAARALHLIRDGAESRRETHLRLQLLGHGLPEPDLQGVILDAHGRFVARGDLVYPAFKVLVEYDGQQHRESSMQFHHDVARHEALLAEGWTHLRADLHTPLAGRDSAPARTERALRARGWSPGTPVPSLSAPKRGFSGQK